MGAGTSPLDTADTPALAWGPSGPPSMAVVWGQCHCRLPPSAPRSHVHPRKGLAFPRDHPWLPQWPWWSAAPPMASSPRLRGAGRGAHLAHEVGEVEHGHGEDGQPLAQDAVADLRLKAGEQAQRDEVGHSDGQHVGPDDTGHRVAVQQQGCRGRLGVRAAHRGPRPLATRAPPACADGTTGPAGLEGRPP